MRNNIFFIKQHFINKNRIRKTYVPKPINGNAKLYYCRIIYYFQFSVLDEIYSPGGVSNWLIFHSSVAVSPFIIWNQRLPRRPWRRSPVPTSLGTNTAAPPVMMMSLTVRHAPCSVTVPASSWFRIPDLYRQGTPVLQQISCHYKLSKQQKNQTFPIITKFDYEFMYHSF